MATETDGPDVRHRLAVALAALLVVAAAGLAAASFSSAKSASMSVSTASLGAPTLSCTSTTGIFGAVQLSWTKPAALTGKAAGPLSYTVERRANSGAWSTLASGLTTTTYSDNPSALLALGTVWQYRVTAVYGNWTSPVSSSISAIYTVVALVTVLSTCS